MLALYSALCYNSPIRLFRVRGWLMQGRESRNVLIGIVVFLILAMGCAAFCCASLCGSSMYLLIRGMRGMVEPTPAPSDFREIGSADQGELAQRLEEQIADMPTTDVNYWAIYGQLESGTGEPVIQRPVQGPTEYQVGDIHTFWMGDEEQQRYWQVDAVLEVKTEHAYFYVTRGTSFDMSDLRRAADLFESQIYPTNQRYFGSEWTPGIDNDPHITILVTDQMPWGIAGYFSANDEYPRAMSPRSNEREMICVTDSYLDSLDLFGQLLSHEYQHMIHWNQDISEATWVNEGLSLLAEEINGYEDVLGSWEFWSDSDIQLTNWAEDFDDRTRNYAASKLFLSYLSEHYGGYEILSRLTAEDANGIEGINRALAASGYDVDFVDVFADWTIANLLNDPHVGDGRYSYALRGFRAPETCGSASAGREYRGWVHQFGADYVEIDPGAGGLVVFEGSELVRLAATDPHDGEFAWWSNRRDMLSSSLTRLVDLQDVAAATLHFWTWYDIEENFDYAYVTVSTDGGRTWQTLQGTHTTSEDPNDANYGYGYTGKSGQWLEEEVDLSPYAGQQVLLRFWYITDPNLNQSGWLIDDISIPEIGFYDGAEEESDGWTADGFVRSSNELRQRYIVHLVEFGPQTTVRRLQLDSHNRGEIALQEDTRRAILVVSGATYWTSERAPYRVAVEP